MEQKHPVSEGATGILLVLLLALSLGFAGGFYTYTSAICTLILLVWLTVSGLKRRCFVLQISLFGAGVLLVCILHFATFFYGIDASMSLKGGVKFLPALLFFALLLQCPQAVKEKGVRLLPYLGGAQVLLSLALIRIPVFRERILVDQRLGGLFEYPNSFAAFLLVGLVIGAFDLLLHPGLVKGAAECVCMLLVLVGIVLSASRTVYVLTALFFLIFPGICIRRWLQGRGSVRKGVFLICIALALLVILLWVSGAGDAALQRILSIGRSSSTLTGRFLYVQDALKILRDHPWGLGYYGYRFIQSSYKTGVYTVVNVHNELMQTALDVGVLPALLLLAGVLRALFAKQCPLRNRLALGLLLLHALFDYDFQFLGLIFTALLLLPTQGNHTIALTKMRAWAVGLLGAALLSVSVMAGLSDFYYVFRDFETSERLAKNTLAEMNLLTLVDDLAQREQLADRMLQRNAYASAAYEAAAEACFARGEIQSMTVYQKAAIRTNPYSYTLYQNYLRMLYDSARAYAGAGDLEDAKVCARFAREIADLLEELKTRTSPLGWNISVQPVTRLDEKSQKMLDVLEKY